MAAVFDADFSAWMKSLSRKARVGEPAMQWTDLGPHAHTAYQMHCDIASKYAFAVTKKLAPALLPDDATPQGFYKAAVLKRREQVGKALMIDTPWERLSAFSRFLYTRMAERIARSAGFKTAAIADDGLGSDDDGLGEPDDDGLGGNDGIDEMDDGLSGLADDGLGSDDDGL